MAGDASGIGRDATTVAVLLDSPEVTALIAELVETRWTGRPGFPIRMMVGVALVKSMYCLPTWTRTIRLIGEHEALQRAIGVRHGDVPSVHAAYRFARKLRENNDMLARCIDKVLAGLADVMPDIGVSVAIDGSDLPAYANGQRHLFNGGPERTRFSDPDATWGHRSSISTRKGGGYYGYKIHAAVCTTTGLPVAWHVDSAAPAEPQFVPRLLDTLARRGVTVTTAILDKGYDQASIYECCEARGIRPVVPLIRSASVKAGKHKPPTCEHGAWTFAGSDSKRQASKWRCPTGDCTPASRWVKADRLHTLIPRSTDRWKDTYKLRGAVEREFGRLKHEWAMLPLRVRSLVKVRLHVDLTILAKLATVLAVKRTALVT